MIDDKEFETVSQLSHFGWGVAVVLAGNLWGLQYWFFAVWVLYAAIKEFWYDEHYESAEVRGSSVVDFIFQLAGACAGLGLIRIATAG